MRKQIINLIFILILLMLFPIKLHTISIESLISKGNLDLLDGDRQINIDTVDLYNIKNSITDLERKSKETIVKYINSIDKGNVLLDISEKDNNDNYKDYEAICKEILNTQRILDKGKTVYKTYYGEYTQDTKEESIIFSGAIADNLSAGTGAWVDGYYIVGNGKDNKRYYDKGYQDGLDYVSANSSYEVVYTYHAHGDGYCNSTPKYHQHTGSASSGGGCYGTANICYGRIKLSRSGCDIETYASKCYYVDHSNVSPCFNRRCPQHHCTETYKCSGCGATYSKEGTCTRTRSYSTNCGKTTSTIDSYYCSIPEGTITSATVVFY